MDFNHLLASGFASDCMVPKHILYRSNVNLIILLTPNVRVKALIIFIFSTKFLSKTSFAFLFQPLTLNFILNLLFQSPICSILYPGFIFRPLSNCYLSCPFVSCRCLSIFIRYMFISDLNSLIFKSTPILSYIPNSHY